MVTSIIFRNTSFAPSIKAITGLTLVLSTINSVIPKNIAKKITCNIRPLFPKEIKMLLGTISTKNFNGLASFVALAVFPLASILACVASSISSSFTSYSLAYFEVKSFPSIVATPLSLAHFS